AISLKIWGYGLRILASFGASRIRKCPRRRTPLHPDRAVAALRLSETCCRLTTDFWEGARCPGELSGGLALRTMTEAILGDHHDLLRRSSRALRGAAPRHREEKNKKRRTSHARNLGEMGDPGGRQVG